jgi:hypothetical protein
MKVGTITDVETKVGIDCVLSSTLIVLEEDLHNHEVRHPRCVL